MVYYAIRLSIDVLCVRVILVIYANTSEVRYCMFDWT